MINHIFNRKDLFTSDNVANDNDIRNIFLVICCAIGFMFCGQNSLLTLFINSLLIPLIWLILLKTDYFDAMIFPLAFYFNHYGMSFNFVSIIWIYFVLYFLKYIFIEKQSISIKNIVILLTIGVLQLLYPISGLLNEGLKYVGFLLCVLLYFGKKRHKNNFFPVYIDLIFFCIASSLMPLFGLYQTRVITLTDGINRFSAGGIYDPNYTSFIMAIGLVAALCSSGIEYKWWKYVRFIAIILFLFTILRSVSITGIIGVITILMIYAIILYNKAENVHKLLIAILILITIIILVNVMIPNILKSILWRLELIINNYNDGDYNAVLSDRVYIFKNYWDYFTKKDFLHTLLGLNSIPNTELINMMGGVTHNSYIDMLYMYGVIGTLVVLYALLKKTIGLLSCFTYNHNKDILFIVLCSISLLCFSLTISILPTVQWIVLYFLQWEEI